MMGLAYILAPLSGKAKNHAEPEGGRHKAGAGDVMGGKGYKFTAENVALLLQAAMKDVSPNA